MTMKINLGRNGRVGVVEKEKEECLLRIARSVGLAGWQQQINLLAAGIPTRRAIFRA